MQYKHTTEDGRDVTLFFEHNQGYCLNVSQSFVDTINTHSATNVYGYGYTGFKRAKIAFESVSGVKLSSLLK